MTRLGPCRSGRQAPGPLERDGALGGDGRLSRRLPSTLATLPAQPATLAQHLQAHPLIVALPLALYDVPEVRARVAL